MDQVATLTRQLVASQNAHSATILQLKQQKPSTDNTKQIAAMELEMGGLNAKLEQANKRESALIADITNLKQEMKQALISKDEAMSSLDKELQELKIAHEQCQSELQLQKEQTEQRVVELKAVQTTLSDIKSQYSATTIRLQESQARVGTLQLENKKLTQQPQSPSPVAIPPHKQYQFNLVPRGCPSCQGDFITV